MDIPFPIFIFYSTIALNVGIIGIWLGVSKKMDGAPFITVFAGFLFLIPVILVEDIEMGYTEERSILVNKVIVSTGANTTTTTHMNTTDSGTGSNLLDATNIFIGEELGASSSLIGDSFNTVKIDMEKNGSPTGIAVIGVWDSTATPTNANFNCQINTLDVSTLTTSRETITFSKPSGSCSASSGDIIGIFFDNGDVSNNIQIYKSTVGEGDLFDGGNSYFSVFNGGWNDQTTQDVSMGIFNIIETEDSDTEEILSYDTVGNSIITYPFNQNDIWVFSIMVGLLFVFMGLMIQFSKIK